MKFITSSKYLQTKLGNRGRRVQSVEAEHDVARQVVGRARTGGSARHTERGGRARRAVVRRRARALGHHQLHLAEERATGRHRSAHVTEDGGARGVDGGGVAARRGKVARPKRRRPHCHGRRRAARRRRVHLVDHVTYVDEIRRIVGYLALVVANGRHCYTSLLENNSVKVWVFAV
jgi:hypothetical protein